MALAFANVLKDLGLPQNMLLLTLLAFNLGGTGFNLP